MRVDVAGNLYVGAGDGVQVFSPGDASVLYAAIFTPTCTHRVRSAGGKLIGKIIVAPDTPDDQSGGLACTALLC